MTAQSPTTTTKAILGADTLLANALALFLEGAMALAMALVVGPAGGEG